jgi:hypothetical protein
LFLALRLALVSSHARRGVRLPLVLDDVFVNFDAARAKAAALVLRDFARAGHQLLIFTCHEHIARLFRHLKTDVRQLPDNAEQTPAAVRPLVEEAAPRRQRRERPETPLEPEHVPEPEPEESPVAAETAEIEPQLAPSPVPAQSPPRIRPRAERRIERVQWSAEEFEGELADRVRRPATAERESSRASDTIDAEDDEDAEAA